MELNPSSIVGRVAQLIELKSKPELNESYVEVSSYDPASSRFAVRTLVSPTLVTPSIMVSVKLLNLKLMPSFESLYPAAEVMLGSTFVTLTDRSATVLDYSNCRVFTGGNKSLMNASRVPTTRFEAVVLIKCPNPGAVVAFHDIHFTRGSSNEAFTDYGVYCMYVDNVKFKNCRFSGMKIGCAVGGPLGAVNAVFENCVFEDNETAAVVVESEEGHATLLNCVLRRVKSGIRIEAGGSAVLKHCVITEVSEAGASMYAKGKYLEMINCTVGPTHSLATGVNSNRSGDVFLRGCLFQNIEAAAVGLDGVRNAVIDNCTIRDTANGVMLTTGDNHLTVSHCHLHNIRNLGICIGRGSTGSVDITCDPADHICDRVYHDSGPKCRLTVDGRVWPPVQHTTTHDREYFEYAQEILSKDVVCELDRKNIINRMKAQKKAGTGHVQCFNCDKIEPDHVRFKRCSRCESVCYCSKECQVDHWKVHKKDCKGRVIL